MTDVYQERYLAHQARKKEKLENQVDGDEDRLAHYGIDIAFWELSMWRRSQRIFNGKEIPSDDMNFITDLMPMIPSSCNRQGIRIKIVSDKIEKVKLEELLVGGKGWLGKSDKILLLLADMHAYKSPNERDFMPYLDAGFIGMGVYYAAEARGVGCCFVNPNIREENKNQFDDEFGFKDSRMCGAIALGMYDKKANKVPKSSDIFI